MKPGSAPLKVGGYVLAGGRSSRMGSDKALLKLADKPLVQHATAKLHGVCAGVALLSARPELAAFGRLLPDRHPECGPLGGMEAALLDTPYVWNLVIPVDVPFLPAAYLHQWVERVQEVEEASGARGTGARVSYGTAGERAHPTVALLHREVGPFLTAALERGERRLQPALAAAARQAAAAAGHPEEAGLVLVRHGWPASKGRGPGAGSPGPQCQAGEDEAGRWFANLNTPEDYAEAERCFGELDG